MAAAGAFAVILASAFPLPRSLAAEQQWLRAMSQNFELYTDDSEASVRDTLLQFETARAFFLPGMRALGLRELPVRIIAFRSSADYLRYCPTNLRWSEVTAPPPAIDTADISGDFHDVCAAAYLLRSPLRSSVVMTFLRNASSHVSPLDMRFGWKSYVDLALEGAGPKLPPRLKAALKEFYGGVFPVMRQLKVYVPFLPSGPFAVLTSPFGKSESDYALLHMLAFGAAYRSNFSASLKAIGDGEDPKAALSRIYRRSLSQVEKDLKSYPDHPAGGQGVPVELAQPFAPEVRSATLAESEGVLAELKANATTRGR
jgi:hypothetical protein